MGGTSDYVFEANEPNTRQAVKGNISDRQDKDMRIRINIANAAPLKAAATSSATSDRRWSLVGTRELTTEREQQTGTRMLCPSLTLGTN